MKTTMLEYCKTVLGKVSFCRKLFLKEYRKSRHWLTAHEGAELKNWIRSYKQRASESKTSIY
jgi:hypothetical protein